MWLRRTYLFGHYDRFNSAKFKWNYLLQMGFRFEGYEDAQKKEWGVLLALGDSSVPWDDLDDMLNTLLPCGRTAGSDLSWSCVVKTFCMKEVLSSNLSMLRLVRYHSEFFKYLMALCAISSSSISSNNFWKFVSPTIGEAQKCVSATNRQQNPFLELHRTSNSLFIPALSTFCCSKNMAAGNLILVYFCWLSTFIYPSQKYSSFVVRFLSFMTTVRKRG